MTVGVGRDEDLGALVDRVPEGWTPVVVGGRRYGLRRTSRAGGRSVSVYAEELGGTDVVSTNVYRTSSGDVLRPCEMPAADVLAFLRSWTVLPAELSPSARSSPSPRRPPGPPGSPDRAGG